MRPSPVRKLLNIYSVSDYLDRTPASIRNLVARRKIPFRKAGGRLVFFSDEIDTWLDKAPGITINDLEFD